MAISKGKTATEIRALDGTPKQIVDGLVDHGMMRAVYVYQAPLRLWHWVTVAAIFTLMVTGYLIGEPLPSVGGEASGSYVMGYVRLIHFIAGQVFAIAFVGRIYWHFAGNEWAKELFVPKVWTAKFWSGFWYKIRFYLFLTSEKRYYIAQNPLQNLAAFVLFVLVSVWMICSGLAMYGEGLGTDSWASMMFGWVIPLVGQSQDVHTFHRLGMWTLVIFTLAHMYFVFRDDIESRQSVISTMASGYRYIKD